MIRHKSFLDRLVGLLWGLALVTLPVTSFRYFPFLGNETQVRPLSLYPLGLLLPLLLIRILQKRTPKVWAGSLIPLGAFLLVALATTTWSALYTPVDLYNNDYWGRALRAWVSMAIGLIFLLCSLWMNQTQEELRYSLKWLYLGLFLHFLWGSVQASSLFLKIPAKSTIDSWQELFSIRGLVKAKRISGLAFEPSWLAGQIFTLYFPWLFASISTGYRLSRLRWIEPALTTAAVGLTLLTYSRSGIALLALISGLTFLLTSRDQVVRAWGWLVRPIREPTLQFRDWVTRSGLLMLLIAMLAGLAVLFAQSNYFAQLWRSEKSDLVEYVVDIYAGPRLAYAWAAWDIYQAHPLSGVGLGASGLYLHRYLPDWSLTTIPEIARLLSPENRLYPNPKNIYMRLLAETGLFGFWPFLIFYLSVLGVVRGLLSSSKKEDRFLRTAGLFIWLAVILYGFTQDSFAMPNMWIGIGILLGMANPSNSLSGSESSASSQHSPGETK